VVRARVYISDFKTEQFLRDNSRGVGISITETRVKFKNLMRAAWPSAGVIFASSGQEVTLAPE
jgi:hypothetical protein